MGGSLGLALRASQKKGFKKFHLLGLGRRKALLLKAKKMGAVHEFTTDMAKGLSQVDVVVICLPVHKIVPFIQTYKRFFKSGAIISDVGSVKGNIVQGMSKILKIRPDLHFVGGHPIAGSEKTGVANAKANLYQKAICVLTQDQASFKALNTLRAVWKATGARCLLMKAAEHDQWLALTSHLPHLLAFALFQRVQKSSESSPILKELVGGSFKDMTRIAGADPEIWTGIIDSNRSEIKKSIHSFLKDLRFYSTAKRAPLTKMLEKVALEKSRW